jgi:hypothetical protein
MERRHEEWNRRSDEYNRELREMRAEFQAGQRDRQTHWGLGIRHRRAYSAPGQTARADPTHRALLSADGISALGSRWLNRHSRD